MKNRKDHVWDLWYSHENYIGKRPVQGVDMKALTTFIGNLFAPGPFYYYVIDSPNLRFEFVSDSVRDVLGYEPKDFTMAGCIELIHPDDMDFFYRCEDVVARFLKNHVSPEQMTKYKITYCVRIKASAGNYKLVMMQTVTMKVDESGALLKVFGSHTDVGHLLDENNYRMSLIGLQGEPSYLNLDVFSPNVLENFTAKAYPERVIPFSGREREIIRLLASGKETPDVAAILCISPQTVRTHRKNILRKSGCDNTASLISECIRQGYI